ncbi:MAG: hypothetical protein WC389_00175 [Lutibacter sp.]|jgi:hypothetical protein
MAKKNKVDEFIAKLPELVLKAKTGFVLCLHTQEFQHIKSKITKGKYKNLEVYEYAETVMPKDYMFVIHKDDVCKELAELRMITL